LYLRTGEYERAVLDNDEAIRINPRYPLVYVNQALAYTYLGKDEEARQDVERVGDMGIGSTLMTAFEAPIEAAKKRR
jgi:Tfp pilus assembly protein PilF